MQKDEFFIIDTPPPTVSGQLHMGHVFSYSHADFIARYKRMKGHEVIYPIGFDDNGLPTERLVEKITGKKGKDYQNKEEFLQNCQSIINEAEIEFKKLFETLGYSYDWDLKYQTISDSSAKIAQWSFKDLYDKGLIYQSHKPVYWDVIDQTALANADIEEIEQDGFQCYFNFKLCDEDGIENGDVIEIMTTRPEMLPACLAVMYNPNHPNAANFEGKFAKVPLSYKFAANIDSDLIVRLIADKTVKPKEEKGTGAMMVCSYGDWHDVELIEKHKLKSNVIIHQDGKMGDDMYSINKFKNPQEARKFVIQYCEDNNLFSQPKIAKKQMVKVGERSKHPVEIIETSQIYLKIKDFKEDFKLISKHIKFHPEHMRNRLEQWIDSIDRDWCISRDRFMGIEIPLGYHYNYNIDREPFYKTIPDNPSKYPYHSGQEFERDFFLFEIQSKQVFDTWFTSSCTPQIVARYLNKDFDDGKKFDLPMQMRTQSHEIIRTWAFYTIVKAYLHGLSKEEIEERQKFSSAQEWFKHKGFDNFEIVKSRGLIPWENIILSGWCLASDKTKMSKSKGNIITPQSLIEEKGIDTIRYWAACSHLGVDTPYNETKFIDAKRLLTKLENAYKFGIMIKNNAKVLPSENFDINLITEEFDKWILFKFFTIFKNYENEFEKFEYSKAKEQIEKFFWQDFCDNYLEIIKVRGYGLDAFIYKDKNLSEGEISRILTSQKSASITLLILIDGILKLFAPFLINKTDDLYRKFCNELKIEDNDIHSRGNWINEDNFVQNFKHFQNAEQLIDLIAFIRKEKSEKNLSMKAEISILKSPIQILEAFEKDFRNVINANNAKFEKAEQNFVEFVG